LLRFIESLAGVFWMHWLNRCGVGCSRDKVLNVAIIVDKFRREPMPSALVPIDFSSEQPPDNSLEDRYKPNVPCPDLILPVAMDGFAQLAIMLVCEPPGDNLGNVGNWVP
jgi:hypothetical protein